MSGTANELLREHLKKATLLSLSTVREDGGTRSVVVWFGVDEDLRLVFMSQAIRRHCADLRADPRVSGTILHRADLTDSGPGSPVRGVMFSGEAHEASGAEIEPAFEAYRARWPANTKVPSLAEFVDGSTPNRLYVITPSTFTLFNEPHFVPLGENPLQELTEW